MVLRGVVAVLPLVARLAPPPPPPPPPKDPLKRRYEPVF